MSSKPLRSHRAWAAACLLTLLAACTATDPLPPAASPPGLRAQAVEVGHEVFFATDADQPSAIERQRLRTFLSQLDAGRSYEFRVAGHADERASQVYNLALAGRRADVIAEALRADGFVNSRISLQSFGEAAPAVGASDARAWSRNRRVQLTASTFAVIPPACPDWTSDGAFDPANQPFRNLGCANTLNLGLMLADPGDLVGRRHLGPADGTREADAVARYRAGKVTPLEEAVSLP